MTTAIYVLWGIIIAFAACAMVGIVFTYLFNRYKFRWFLHIGWCCMSFLALLGFVFAALFVPVSVISLDTCGVVNEILGSSAGFNTYANGILTLNSDVNTKMQVCLFGNGDLLSNVGIANQIQMITNVSNSMNTWSNSINNASVNNISGTTSTITYWKNYVNMYTLGKIVDSSSTNNDNAFISLQSLNSVTNYGASGSQQSAAGCSVSRDTWVFSQVNCTGTTWQSFNSPTTGLGSQMCIDIPSFTTSTESQRYSSLGACSPALKTSADQSFQALLNHDTDRRLVFGNIENGLTNLIAQNDALVANVASLNTKIQNYKTNMQYLLNNVTDPAAGLLSGFNCTFLSYRLQTVSDSMCIAFLPAVYTLTALVISAAIMMMVASFFMFRLAMSIKKKIVIEKKMQEFKKVKPSDGA